ncbi:GMC oxidoreductase [Granulicella arctica]|uniref:GMC oxidoreductase n=1 Tax=Granulicella arctica TaxID=940613 RepID=UPI0021DFDDEB|nr:GMC family oxidoreductase [Granulicella arctica]
MQIDLESVPPGQAAPYRTQICIVGGGIAGLVLATTLARSGIEVHLLEAGGQSAEPEARSQEIYTAAMAASHHSGTTEGRFRTFGGSSTRWGGQLLPYTADIFVPPVETPSHAWPFGPEAISRFYPQVEDLLGVDHLPYTADIFEAFDRNIPTKMSSSSDITLRASKWAPFARRNLAPTLGEQAISSPKATVFFHANVTELLISSDGTRLEAVLVRNYQGTTFRFEAQHYVLAAGTIETSRLLLASRSVAPTGVGNDRDLVGRGFHDHISYPAAELTGLARTTMLQWFAPILEQGTTHTAKLEASPPLRERLNILATMAHITINEPENSGAAVVRSLLRSMQRGDLRGALIDSLPRLPGASIEIARLAYNAKVRKRRAVSRAATVTLRIDTEQRARSENRIRLDSVNQDALGLPKTIVDWRISDDETDSIRTYAAYLREQLPHLGTGPITWQPELSLPDAPLSNITDTYHPMGGTLMGTDPTTSVVNPDLRLHDVANLSVASCATYPAGGSSNPTFTLMALTLRLAEHLQLIIKSE